MTTMTVMVAKFSYIRLAQLSYGGEEEDLGDDIGNGNDDDSYGCQVLL